MQFLGKSSFDDLGERDSLSKQKKNIFIPKEKENDGTKYKLNNLFEHKKNFVLKGEICEKLRDNKDIHSKPNNINQINPIINYYYNNNYINYNDYRYFDLRHENLINNNYYYNNISDINKEKKNINNSGINNDQTIENNKANSISTNNSGNGINTNNYYLNEINSNSNYMHSNSFSAPSLTIKNKFGCLMMKNKILSDPSYANEILFPQIKNDAKDLCCDTFGNYFLQSFLDIITFDNLNEFLDLITKDFTDICVSSQGTRVIQKLIDKISFIPILLNKFIFILNSQNFGFICKSLYGHHIIQKFILTFHSSEYTIFVYNNIYKNFIDISNSKHGVFIVQKCISEGNKIQREKLYRLILYHLNEVISNEFGNYLIQYILLNKENVQQNFQEILPIMIKMEQNIINLCISKYPASLLEKCFEKSDNMIRNHMLEYLFNHCGNKIFDIFFNKYGIYVILKAAKTQNGKYKNKLISVFNENIDNLKQEIAFNINKCKNILKIAKKYRDLDDICKIIESIINNK